ncbi:MAG: hypothetical protein Q7T05_07085 [Dehalococcoidia bacterium]|nr:hypothetical protein [Dehalococcoidia bacterium]
MSDQTARARACIALALLDNTILTESACDEMADAILRDLADLDPPLVLSDGKVEAERDELQALLDATESSHADEEAAHLETLDMLRVAQAERDEVLYVLRKVELLVGKPSSPEAALEVCQASKPTRNHGTGCEKQAAETNAEAIRAAVQAERETILVELRGLSVSWHQSGIEGAMGVVRARMGKEPADARK